MTKTGKRIFDEFLNMDREERTELAGLLFEEFGPPDVAYEEAWAAELERRINDINSGKSKLIPWEEVRAGLGLPPRKDD